MLHVMDHGLIHLVRLLLHHCNITYHLRWWDWRERGEREDCQGSGFSSLFPYRPSVSQSTLPLQPRNTRPISHAFLLQPRELLKCKIAPPPAAPIPKFCLILPYVRIIREKRLIYTVPQLRLYYGWIFVHLATQYRPRQHIIIVQKFIYTTHNALYSWWQYICGCIIDWSYRTTYSACCSVKLLQSWYVLLLWRGSGRPHGLSVIHYIPGSGGWIGLCRCTVWPGE